MKILVLTIIVVLFILFISIFAYLYVLYNSISDYENEHNFRRREKEYKENNSFVEDLYHEEKYQNFLKHGKKKNK
jgi:hypothetical protein